MHQEDGPPLPLGQQLRGGAEPEILRAFHLLYWPYFISQVAPVILHTEVYIREGAKNQKLESNLALCVFPFPFLH